MVRFLRSTHLASVALLLALPGWTTGAGELFKAVVGLASAADTNRLAQNLGSTVETVAGLGGAMQTGAGLAAGLAAENPEIAGAISPDAGANLAAAAAGTLVSAGGGFLTGRSVYLALVEGADR